MTIEVNNQQLTPIENTTADVFFQREGRLITDYAEGLPVVFKPGKGWAVNPDTGEATYDPNFFTEQGYSQTQSLFATLHEVDHVVEKAQLLASAEGKEIDDRRKTMKKQKRRVHILENCLLDVADNRRVLTKAPALRYETSRLYSEKLFPGTDLTKDPRHLQLAYAILRTAMLPDEPVQIDPAVSEAIERLNHVRGKRGKTHNVIAMVTDPSLDPIAKIKLVEKYIEPEYEALFQKDKEEKKRQKGSRGDTSGGSGEEDDFSSDYDAYDQRMPDVFSEEERDAAATGGKEDDAGNRQQAGYEKEHGVSMQDSAAYYTEYKEIEQYIEAMREQFRRIVEERLIPKRKLKGFKDEGVMIAPGLSAQAQIDFSRGEVDSPVFMDFEGAVRREEVPAAFELTGVFDRSGSMELGGKKQEQRRAAILLMEALAEFMNQPEVRDGLLDPNMRASSEIRSLGGTKENVIIKPLSPELAEQQRIAVFKTLDSCPGGATMDYAVLEQIINEMKEREAIEAGYLERVKRRQIKKLVVVFSDGASSDESVYNQKKNTLESMGVAVVDYRRIRDNVNFTSQMAKILTEALDGLCYAKSETVS